MPRPSSVAFLALVAACLAACSSGGTTTPIPNAGQAPGATRPLTSTTQPTSNPAAAGAGTDICALLPADQVAQITGQTIASSLSDNNFLTANDARCQYTIQPTSPGDSNQVVIDVISPGGTAYYDNLASGYGSNVSPIAGIGDKAFQDFTDGSGLVALFGDSAFDVYIDNPNDAMSDDAINRASEALITALKAKL